MAFYNYYCPNCDEIIEIVKSIKDESEEYCPKCKNELYRTCGVPIFQFRGKGWYETDYKKK